MPNARRLAALGLSIVLVVAACGDDDGGTTTPSTEGGQPIPTTGAATAGDGSGSEDLAELLDRYASARVRTTYLIGEGDAAQRVVLSQDPTANPAIASILLGDDEGKIISEGDTTIFCGGDADDNVCFEVPGAGAGNLATGLLGPVAAGFLVSAGGADSAAIDVTTEDITIAGRTGTCFTLSPESFVDSDTTFVRQCVDDEFGFTLLIETREEGSDLTERIMELIEFGEPRPEDFEPTGPVTPAP